MNDYKWDKDRHHTWYNQWDYKIPRSYKERYGVDYHKDNFEKDEKITSNILIVIAILIIVGMLWIQN